MKKWMALLLAAAMCTAMMAGCGSEPASEETGSQESTQETTETPAASETETESESGSKVLTYNLAADPKTLDPNLNSSSDGSKVLVNEFEGLLRDKSDGNGPQPAMAAEMPQVVENADGTVTYTFTLRDANWSDGVPVKAQDFVFAYQRMVDPATAAEYAYMMAPILNAEEIIAGEKDKSELGVKAIEDKTLEITLKHTCGYFEGLLCHPTYLPLREDVVGTDVDGLWAKDPEKIVSNGPFTLTEYTMGDQLVLTKNPEYWDAENVNLDQLVFKMIVDEGTSLTAFHNGEVDMITDTIPAEEVQQLIATGECQLYPLLNATYYKINAQTEIEALQDVRVRKALSMAIDRKALVENVTRSGEAPAMGLVPYGMTVADGSTDFRDYAGSYYLTEEAQLEEAKALLAEAGYPEGEGIPTIQILYNTKDLNKSVAEAIQEMWKELGIQVELVNQEWAVFQDNLVGLQYPAIARDSWSGDYTDPMTFMDMYTSGNVQSACGYANPAYDEQIAIAANSQGEEHFAAYAEAERVIMEDAYIIPLYYSQMKVCMSPSITGVGIDSLGKLWFGNADIVAE